MVDDWVTAGYDHTEANEDARAADVWLRVWEHVRPRLEPHMTTFRAVDPVFKISQFFGNWIQDFVMAIANAALRDRKYAEAGIRLAHEVLKQFADEETNTVLNFRCDLGRLLFLAERREEGEDALLAVIREYPHLGHGYITLSEELSFRASRSANLLRAMALLEQALSYPVEDADDWGINARLTYLRTELAKVADEERKSQ
jgi:hypothetical protein